MPIIKHPLIVKLNKLLNPNTKPLILRFKNYTTKITEYNLLYYYIILFAFLIRIYHLNYNSPFSDEAIYIVIGKLGVFQGDWWSYNAASWMGGSPYFYPTISAISSVTGGIIASRFLNVVFGVLAVETIFRITMLLNNNKKIISGLISAIVISASATAIYVSRLATYDMPSYFFAIMGAYLLLIAEKSSAKSGKYYFLSSVFIIFAVLTKIIIAIYLPIIIIYSFLFASNISKNQRAQNNKLFFWKRYFIPPLTLVLILYITIYLSSITAFFNIQFDREKVGYLDVLLSFVDYLAPSLVLFAVASVGLVIKKMWKLLYVIIFLAFVPLIFHLASNRTISLDKHAFMSLAFLSIGIGIGLDNLYSLNSSSLNKVKKKLLFAGLSIYVVVSFSNAGRYNQLWRNSNQMLSFIESKVKKDDLILAENGPEVIFSTYNTNFPLNTTTFDYFEYMKSTKLEAYQKAILDGYFNIVEVEINDDSKTDRFKAISSLVAQDINKNYKLAYSDDAYIVYLRKY